MPANKEAYIRYRIIDSCLRNRFKPYPTLAHLVDKCTEVLGKYFSESTIQKDLLAMRSDEGLAFKAPISYSKIEMGYYYTDENFSINSIPLTEEEITAIEFASGILQQFKDVGFLKQFENAIDKIREAVKIGRTLDEGFNDIIQVEQAPYLKGLEHLEELVYCIKNDIVVEFDYHPFNKKTVNRHCVHPYLIKEYRNRWYLIGMHDHYKKIRTFGIDRVEQLKRTEIDFEKMKGFKAADFFKYSFGITTDINKQEEVVLSFTPLEGSYIKTQHLHSTQKILVDNDKEFRISITVYPTHELQMQILGYGANVKILKPKWLASKIKGAHLMGAGRYGG